MVGSDGGWCSVLVKRVIRQENTNKRAILKTGIIILTIVITSDNMRYLYYDEIRGKFLGDLIYE